MGTCARRSTDPDRPTPLVGSIRRPRRRKRWTRASAASRRDRRMVKFLPLPRISPRRSRASLGAGVGSGCAAARAARASSASHARVRGMARLASRRIGMRRWAASAVTAQEFQGSAVSAGSGAWRWRYRRPIQIGLRIRPARFGMGGHAAREEAHNMPGSRIRPCAPFPAIPYSYELSTSGAAD